MKWNMIDTIMVLIALMLLVLAVLQVSICFFEETIKTKPQVETFFNYKG